MPLRRILVMAFLPLICACATLSPPPDCAGGDWRAMGALDGETGRGLGVLSERRKACGAPTDAQRTAYLAGRKAGLARYCDPATAFEKGLASKIFEGFCPALPSDALDRYRLGRQIALVREEIYDVEYALASSDSGGFYGYPAGRIAGARVKPGGYGFGRKAFLHGRLLDLEAELRSLERLGYQR